MKSTITEHEEATTTTAPAASIRIEATSDAVISGETATSGTGGEDAVILPTCCHYCGTVEEADAPFVVRLGSHIFCDDACRLDFAEANRMIGASETAGKEPFKIDTLAKFDWWTSKLADVADRRKRIAANYKKQLAQLDADEKRAMGLQCMAAEFVKGELERTKSKRSSVTTLHGTGGFTRYGASVVLLPDATTSTAVMAAARAAGCVKIVPAVAEREEVDTAAYLKLAKDALKDKAHLPPGCDTTPPREVFKFTLAKDEDTTK